MGLISRVSSRTYRDSKMMNESPSQEFLSSGSYDEDDLQGSIPGGAWGSPTENDSLTDTLDEPVMTTLMRDMRTIGVKFYHVAIPKHSTASQHLLQDYDLWGPLLVCCTLVIFVFLTSFQVYSSQTKKQKTFSAWFSS